MGFLIIWNIVHFCCRWCLQMTIFIFIINEWMIDLVMWIGGLTIYNHKTCDSFNIFRWNETKRNYSIFIWQFHLVFNNWYELNMTFLNAFRIKQTNDSEWMSMLKHVQRFSVNINKKEKKHSTRIEFIRNKILWKIKIGESSMTNVRILWILIFIQFAFCSN